MDDAAAHPASLSHAAWQDQRRRTLEGGKAPSLLVETATARSLAREGAASMAAGEKLLGVDVGDGASGGDFEIAANKLSADCGTGDNAGDG